MAHVLLTADLGAMFTGGVKALEVEADSVRGVIRALEARYPGIALHLDGGGFAVAIDGAIHQDAFLEPVGPDSEVCFMPAIRGG